MTTFISNPNFCSCPYCEGVGQPPTKKIMPKTTKTYQVTLFQIRKIRALASAGHTNKAISKMMHVPAATVNRVKG